MGIAFWINAPAQLMPWVFINMCHGIYLLCCLKLQKQNLFFMLQAVVDILRNASKVKCPFLKFWIITKVQYWESSTFQIYVTFLHQFSKYTVYMLWFKFNLWFEFF